MHFNDIIRELREDNEMSQKDIAALLNTTQRQYSRWETGQSSFPIEKIMTICKHFNVSADYVLDLPTDSSRTRDEIIKRTKHNIY